MHRWIFPHRQNGSKPVLPTGKNSTVQGLEVDSHYERVATSDSIPLDLTTFTVTVEA